MSSSRLPLNCFPFVWFCQWSRCRFSRSWNPAEHLGKVGQTSAALSCKRVASNFYQKGKVFAKTQGLFSLKTSLQCFFALDNNLFLGWSNICSRLDCWGVKRASEEPPQDEGAALKGAEKAGKWENPALLLHSPETCNGGLISKHVMYFTPMDGDGGGLKRGERWRERYSRKEEECI